MNSEHRWEQRHTPPSEPILSVHFCVKVHEQTQQPGQYLHMTEELCSLENASAAGELLLDRALKARNQCVEVGEQRPRALIRWVGDDGEAWPGKDGASGDQRADVRLQYPETRRPRQHQAKNFLGLV